jgi:hypothetical protein
MSTEDLIVSYLSKRRDYNKSLYRYLLLSAGKSWDVILRTVRDLEARRAIVSNVTGWSLPHAQHKSQTTLLRKAAAHHESGHYVLADAFKLKPKGHARFKKDIHGVVWHKRGTPFQNAAISWAGVIAERIAKDDKVDLSGWFDSLKRNCQVQNRRGYDGENIHAYPDKWRTFKCSAKILLRNRRKLDRIASEMLEGKTVTAEGSFRI